MTISPPFKRVGRESCAFHTESDSIRRGRREREREKGDAGARSPGPGGGGGREDGLVEQEGSVPGEARVGCRRREGQGPEARSDLLSFRLSASDLSSPLLVLRVNLIQLEDSTYFRLILFFLYFDSIRISTFVFLASMEHFFWLKWNPKFTAIIYEHGQLFSGNGIFLFFVLGLL